LAVLATENFVRDATFTFGVIRDEYL
jgi:hypothetical protein